MVAAILGWSRGCFGSCCPDARPHRLRGKSGGKVSGFRFLRLFGPASGVRPGAFALAGLLHRRWRRRGGGQGCVARQPKRFEARDLG